MLIFSLWNNNQWIIPANLEHVLRFWFHVDFLLHNLVCKTFIFVFSDAFGWNISQRECKETQTARFGQICGDKGGSAQKMLPIQATDIYQEVLCAFSHTHMLIEYSSTCVTQISLYIHVAIYSQISYLTLGQNMKARRTPHTQLFFSKPPKKRNKTISCSSILWAEHLRKTTVKLSISGLPPILLWRASSWECRSRTER